MFQQFNSLGYIVTAAPDDSGGVLVVLPRECERDEIEAVVGHGFSFEMAFGCRPLFSVRLGAIERSLATITEHGGRLTLQQAVEIETGRSVAVCDVHTGEVLLVVGEMARIECTVRL